MEKKKNYTYLLTYPMYPTPWAKGTPIPKPLEAPRHTRPPNQVRVQQVTYPISWRQ